ncbi:hypothetical protein AQJ46_19855 [Streptomyces canus]|uniref:DUF8175 domain-containing protein n=1 Tax=Streptomyces canus TaxID=58343 RepID=A0A101S9V1_9ACTN|nr:MULTISPECIES: hypothetical protein [Streptomyces]KUN69996.1 hypothetical protein AQJ46_19855 [Streptomyces canus]MDI5906526.1 hypothetical protein [Streptomyces sp. 12257]
MSLGDDQEGSGGYGGTGQTRTRYPEGAGDVYGGARRSGRSSSRSLVTVVGVIVLLIAAIAFANRGGDDGSSSAEGAGGQPKSSSTAASGETPVQSKSGGVPTGFAHDAQGAQSAAANYSVALGSTDMFAKTTRDAVLQTVITPSRVAGLEAALDKAYTPEFNETLGLNRDGSTPAGHTFVSRTSPIGTKVTQTSADATTVDVWCGGLLGLAGANSTNPVTSSWFTITMQLEWTSNTWKIVTHSQKEGPSPVPGDDKASSADEMANAVQEFGGFTYAR